MVAAHDAENTIASAHRQAAMMKDRLEEQYAWRKEQLEREVAALVQRKAGMVAILQNLRELAGETPLDFPDDDPLGTSDPRETERRSWSPEALPDPSPRPGAGDHGDEAATEVVDEATTVIPVERGGSDGQPTAVQPAVDDEHTTVIHQERDR